MTIELTSVLVKHERRLRLVFSNDLAMGAFGSPAPAFYVISNEDGRSPDPGVDAAIIVAGATSNVELALDTDLVAGALYTVTAIGVPAVDLSTSTSASTESFRFGIPATVPNQEPKVSDTDLLLYSRDIVWTGLDILEAATGDLDTLGGTSNAVAAVTRRLLGSPLPWAPAYSPQARQFVDAPSPSIGGLRGELELQALQDDRVSAARATLVLDDTDQSDSEFQVAITLIGGQDAQPQPIAVPLV